MTKNSGQNYINHVVLLLDASSSMSRLRDKTIRMADELVKFLADKSKASGEETRVSVYTFADEAVCHIWDMDVFRLPSMKEHYEVYGWTALIDAVTLSLDDADLIPEKYGDHDFLFCALTDGEENRSKGTGPAPMYGLVPRSELSRQLTERLACLKDNRSVAILVPDDNGVKQAVGYGFPVGNISVWDATSERGLEAAVEKIKTAYTDYTATRTQTGLRGSKTLFVGGDVNAQAVKAANLTPLPTKNRRIIRVTKTEDAFEKVVKPVTKSRLKPEMGWFVDIEKYVKRVNEGKYKVGNAFYELVKREYVAGDKEIAVVEEDTRRVFVGDGARQLLGLPGGKVSVKPGQNPEYTIYVQSLALNRHLPVGSHIMLLTR